MVEWLLTRNLTNFCGDHGKLYPTRSRSVTLVTCFPEAPPLRRLPTDFNEYLTDIAYSIVHSTTREPRQLCHFCVFIVGDGALLFTIGPFLWCDNFAVNWSTMVTLVTIVT